MAYEQPPAPTLYDSYGKDLYRLSNGEPEASDSLYSDPNANFSGYLTIPADAIGSGVDVAYTEQGTGSLQSGQRIYNDTKQGYFLGLQNGIAVLSVGASGGNSLTWNGTTLAITGAITATTGTIGGFTIGATTITGGTLVLDSAGTIKTASSGQRVEINTDSQMFYDSGAQVIKIGTADIGSGDTRAIQIALNSNSLTGMAITSSTDATLGIRIDSSSNVTTNALRIALTNSGSGNDGYGIYVENDGGAASSYCISVSKAGVGDAIHIANTGTGDAIDVNNAGSAYRAMVVDCNTATANGNAIDFLNTGTATTLYITAAGDRGNDAGVYIDDEGSGDVLGIYQTTNSSLSSIGIHMNISNAGSGTEYAFRFEGAEIVSSAVGGSQDKKIRILVGATAYYIPLNTA